MTRRRHINRSERGLTLLEVLVTLGIIAAVAGIGVQVFTSVGTDTSERLVRLEMREVANAIQRFRNDTGYFPKQGPFAATNDVNTAEPPNLAQLFAQPQNAAGTDILSYDVPTSSGWNGPYLSELDALSVSVGDNLAADGSGNPTAGNAIVVRAVGDPFSSPPVGGAYVWQDGDGTQLAELGRPFFYFIDGSAVTGCNAPCLVSAGPDGEYDQGADDDIVVNIGALN